MGTPVPAGLCPRAHSVSVMLRVPQPRCSRELVVVTCDMCQRVNDCSIQGESQNIQGQTLPRQRRHEY